MGQAPSADDLQAAASHITAVNDLRSSYDRLLASGLDNASFVFHHAFLVRGGLQVRDMLSKHRDVQNIFSAILTTIIPDCLGGDLMGAVSLLLELTQQVSLQSHHFQYMKESLMMTFLAVLGAKSFPPQLEEQWSKALDRFLAVLVASSVLESVDGNRTEPAAHANSPTMNLDSFFGFDHTESESDEDHAAKASVVAGTEVAHEAKPLCMDAMVDTIDYLLYQDKVSLFANETHGFLCVEPERDLQPLLDVSPQPNNFERFLFTFCSTEPGQQPVQEAKGSRHAAPPRMAGDKHVTYGSVVNIKHLYTGKWLCVQKHISANYSRNCYKVQLLPEEAMESACMRFKVVPRYRIRKHGERVRIGDRALLVPDGTNKEQVRYIHASHHKWGGKSHLLEVNCSGQPTAWTILLYDRPLACTEGQQAIRAGEVITLIHKEIDGFLTADATDIVEHFPADPTEQAERISFSPVPSAVSHNSDADLSRLRSKQSFRADSGRLQHSVEVPLHTLCKQLFLILSKGLNSDTTDEAPLYFMQPQVKASSMNPADLETSSNSLWIVEKATPVVGGPLTPGTPYRLKHFASAKYLTVERGPGGAYRPAVTAAVTADTFFVFHTLDQSNVIADSSTSYLRIQHQRTGYWLQCPVAADHHQTTGERASRALHVHNCRVLPLQVVSQIPDGDVFAIVTPNGAPEMGLKHVLHHLRVLQEFTVAFYTHQYPYASVQMRHVIKSAKQSITALILFCTESTEADPLKRTGIPLRRNQKVLIDQGVAKVVLEMLKCPFFVPKDRPDDEPMLAIKEVNAPENQLLYSVCVLCYRFLKQMVFGTPSFALELCSAIPFMMKQLGYRFHVADTLSQMFLDNSMLIEHVNQIMIRQWIEHAKSQKNQLRYAKFLTRICLCDGVNITRIQELVANSVIFEAPELLVPIKYVEAVDGEEAHVAVQLTADAAAGEKKTKKAPELVPMESKLTSKLSFKMGASMVIDRLSSSMESSSPAPPLAAASTKGLLKTVNSVRSMVNWKRKATTSINLRKASTVADLKKGAWVNLSAFCKEIGPALTNNLDATLRLYSEVSYRNDAVKAIIRPRVPLELTLTILGDQSSHKDLADKYLFCFYQLCTRLHLDQRGPLQAERSRIVLWSEVQPCVQPTLQQWFGRNLRPEDAHIASLKVASLAFLSQNSIQIAEKTDRNTLIQAHLEMWNVFVQQSQVTFDEVKALLSSLLPLMDYRTDRMNVSGTGTWERFTSEPQNLVVMVCKARACDILHAVLDSMVESAVHGALGVLRALLAAHEPAGSITEKLMEYLQGYIEAHERLSGLVDVPYLLSILLDLTRSPENALTSNMFRLLFRLFGYRADVNRYLQGVLILFNSESHAIYARHCDVVIAIKWVFEHISQAPTDIQISELITHLNTLIHGLEECSHPTQADLYAAQQDILNGLGLLGHLVQVIRLGNSVQARKRELLGKTYSLMRLLCVGHHRNKTVLWTYLEEFVPHITCDVEADACVREIFSDNPELAAQLQLSNMCDGLVDAFTLLIAQEYTLKPEATMKNLTFLEEIVVVNGVPLPRMQSLVMTSLLKHNSDFIMLLPDPCPTMCDELLQCVSAGVHLIGQCTWGKNSTTETMIQNLFPLEGVLAVISEPDEPIHVRYRLPYVILLTEVWFVTEENETGDGVQENEYKWMVNQTWWETVETFVRVLAEFRDMAVDHPDFVDYQTFVFQGLLPCFSSYLSFFWDGDVAKELPVQVTTITTNLGSLAADYVLSKTHSALWRAEHLDALRKLFEQLLKNNFTCEGQIEASCDELQRFMLRQATDCLSFDDVEGMHQGKMEVEALRVPASERWDSSPVDDLEYFTNIMTEQLEKSGEGEDILRAIIERLKNNYQLSEASQVGLLVFLTQFVEQTNGDEAALYDRQLLMGRIGALSVVTHLFESGAQSSTQAVELGKAVLSGGNTVLQDQMLTYFQSRDEDFFMRVSEEFETAIDALQEREREKSFLKESTLTARTRAAAERAMSGTKAKDKLLCHVTSILRLLQLLCEGHHQQMQNYVRHQHDNLYSFNMVTEIVAFLRAIVSSQPDDTLVEVSTQAVITLTEFCQGPCVDNQRTLVAANICSDASIILQQGYEGCDSIKVHVLHSSVVMTLLSLLEGCNDTMLPTLMVETISWRSACMILEDMWLKIQVNVENNIDLCDEDEEMLDQSFNIYILLYVLLTLTKNAKLDQLIKEVRGGQYFSSMLGVIEIARDDGIEKVYFRKPNACNMLTYEAKQQLLSKVNRDSPASKVSDFYEQAVEVIFELEFYQDAKKYLDCHLPQIEVGSNSKHLKLLRHLRFQIVEYLPQSGVQKLEDATLVVAIAINFAILITAAQQGSLFWTIVQYLLVLQQAVLSIILTVLAALYDLPVLSHRQRMKQRDGGRSERFRPDTEGIFGSGVDWKVLMQLPANIQLQYMWYPFLVVTSLLALAVSPLFCCGHMLGMCRRSAVLQSVIQSITANGRSLILTALLGMAVIYIFSVLAYLQFPEDFVDDEGEEVCTNLAQCFLFTLMVGLRQGGGVGDVMRKSKLTDTKYQIRMVYDFVFFMVVVVILLNIIFGIIIDTFAELRDQRQKVEEDTRRRCFICGVDSDTFDRHIRGGFEYHVTKSHNMWHYLYFIHHLQRKPVDEYTGQESYVQAKILAKDMTFFPLGKSMDLAAAAVPEFVMDNQKAANTLDAAVLQRLERLEVDVGRIEQGVTTLVEGTKGLLMVGSASVAGSPKMSPR
eukprot:EG_transcript_43